MSLIQVGLADKTGAIDPQLIQSVAAAMTIQVTRDLPQFWNVQANVTFLPDASKIPAGVWPVFLVKELPPGEGGFHLDKHNQPFAKVIASSKSDAWTIDASHEILEMLVSLNASGRTIVLITHDPAIAAVASRQCTMRDGRLLEAVAA